jgi:hypothetical protein
MGIHNLSKKQLNINQIKLLSLGLKFIPSKFTLSDSDILNACKDYTRSIRLFLQFGGNNDNIIPKFYIKNPNYIPKKAPFIFERFLFDIHNEIDNSLTKFKNNNLILSDNLKKQKNLFKFHIKNKSNIYQKIFNQIDTLKNDKSIVIKPADKNLGIAIVDITWYLNQINNHLSDIKTYNYISNDKLNQSNFIIQFDKDFEFKSNEIFFKSVIFNLIYRKYMNIIDKFRNFIDKKLLKFLKSFASNPILPSFYLTIKVHKIPISTRPIVASIHWITTGASAFLAYHLRNALNNDNQSFVLKDSTELIRILEKTKVSSNIILVTYDIESLYPSIPLDLAINNINNFLIRRNFNNNFRNFLISLLEFTLKNNYFHFNNNYYHQIKGIAMGTNAAPEIANITLNQLEIELFNNRKNQNKPFPLLYKRFIDDGFLIWKNNINNNDDNNDQNDNSIVTSIDLIDFMNDFNNLHSNFKFNWKINRFSMDFLDLHIFKGNRFNNHGLLDISTHQKELNKYLYIPFSSMHTNSAKKGFIKTELIRYVRNSSSLSDFIHISKLFFNRLRARGYPPNFIKKQFKLVRYENRKKYLEIKNKNIKGINPIFFKITYCNKINDINIAKLIHKIRNDYINNDIRIPKTLICYKKAPNLSNFLIRANFQNNNT